MPELSEFNPSDVEELANRLVDEISAEAEQWWSKNRDLMSGYIRSLAEANLQTTILLETKQISQKQASRAFRSQKLAFEGSLEFSKYMTLVLAQRVLDTVFRVLGWVVYNKTGVNLSPHLITPSSAEDDTEEN